MGLGAAGSPTHLRDRGQLSSPWHQGDCCPRDSSATWWHRDPMQPRWLCLWAAAPVAPCPTQQTPTRGREAGSRAAPIADAVARPIAIEDAGVCSLVLGFLRGQPWHKERHCHTLSQPGTSPQLLTLASSAFGGSKTGRREQAFTPPLPETHRRWRCHAVCCPQR